MKQKQLLWMSSFVVVLLILVGLIGSSTQTALMQAEPQIAQKSSEQFQQQTATGNKEEAKTAVNSLGSTLLIPDGSFEADPSLWTVAASTSCTLSIYAWEDFTENPAYDGVQYFWGGGVCEEEPDLFVPRDNSASITITIPLDNPAISFWYWAERLDPNTFEDFAYVEAERADFNPDILWSYPLEIENNTNGWVKETLDLSDYAGEEIVLRFSVLHGTSQYGGNMYFDFVEFSQPTAETWDATPEEGGNFSYTTASGQSVADFNIPAGAVEKETTVYFKSASSAGFPLYPVPTEESPLGRDLKFAGTAFDLEAFDEFIYLPFITNGSSTQKTQPTQQLDLAVPADTEEVNSFQFNEPVTIRIYYDEAKLEEAGIPEDQVYLYYWTGDGWADAADTCKEPSGYNRNFVENWFELDVCHFSRFGTVG